MRRYKMLGVGLIALVAGCGVFSAHSDVIEQVDGQQFTSQQLADILTSIKAPIQYSTQLGMFITNLWTDMTLFSQAVVNNRLTTDSTLVAQALWPVIYNAKAARWMDTVVARRAKISDQMVDSAYQADKLRAVQHILIKADSNESKADRDAARHKADSLLKLIHGGASFSKLAVENTDDNNAADSGYYPPQPRTTWVKPFGDALWALKPGEVSGVVTTQFGYHIVRRPTEAESKKLWRQTLSQSVAPSVQQAYLTELSSKYNVKLDANAVPHMRAAAEDLAGHADDNTALVSYQGGKFTTGDFVRWIRALTADPASGPQAMQQLKQAPDSMYRSTAQGFTQLSLLVQEADKNGIRLTPVEWKTMQDSFTASMDSLKSTLGLVPPTYNPNASVSERSKVAAQEVDQYFKDLVNQKVPPKALPGVLAATLEERVKTKFNPIALQRGLDLAQAKHSADSAKAGPVAPIVPPGAIKPATGGAPIPGGDTGKAAPVSPKKP